MALISLLRKRQISHDCNEFMKQRFTDIESRLMVTKRERGWERDKLGLADRNYYTHTYTHAHTHTRFYCIAQGK